MTTMPPLLLIALFLGTPPELTSPAMPSRALSLHEAVDIALSQHPEIGEASAAYEQSNLATLRAKLDRFSVSVDAQLQELWVKSSIGAASQDSFSGGLGLSSLAARLDVPIFAGFGVEANVTRATAIEAAASLDVTEARRSVALAVAQAYGSVRRLALLLDVQRRALERISRAETIAASRVDSGLAPPIDRNRARSRRLLEEATVADLSGQREEMTARLAALLQIDERITVVDDALVVPARPPPSVRRLLEEAKAGRADLLAAERRLAAQHEAITIAEAGYYPRLDAFALFQVGNNPFLAGAGGRSVAPTANPFDELAGDFQVGATLSINLFDTWKTHTAVEDARQEATRLGQATRRATQVVEEDVRTAHARVSRLVDLLSRLASSEALAQENLKINEGRYETGEAMVFELLDSEIELLDIERRLTATRADAALAWVELEASLGKIVGMDESHP